MKWKSKGYPIDTTMYKNVVKIAKNIAKQTANSPFIIDFATKHSEIDIKSDGMSGALAVFVFKMFENEDIAINLGKNINKTVNEYENKDKVKVIHDEVEYNRNLSDPKVFYLASEHFDVADDHRDSQGKMYVDKDWRKYVSDKGLRKAVNQYINKNNVKTLQYITMKPTWLITRPNCRHYFKPLSVSDALNETIVNLIDKYDMRSVIGDRENLQTINHSTRERWYEDVRNAELILAKYNERLQYHLQLYQQYKTDLLKNAIVKDRFLIKKWEIYLQSKRK